MNNYVKKPREFLYQISIHAKISKTAQNRSKKGVKTPDFWTPWKIWKVIFFDFLGWSKNGSVFGRFLTGPDPVPQKPKYLNVRESGKITKRQKPKKPGQKVGPKNDPQKWPPKNDTCRVATRPPLPRIWPKSRFLTPFWTGFWPVQTHTIQNR